MVKTIDLLGVIEEIDDSLLPTSMAFDNDWPAESIDNNYKSIKEALYKYDKVFLALGDFGYSDYDEPCFIINMEGYSDRQDIYDFEDDGYYDKYKFELAGYGIYLDKDLNVEYGYFTIAPPPNGHGAGITEYHDFKDAKDGDVIKEEIYSRLDNSYFWVTQEIYIVADEKEKEKVFKKLLEFENELEFFTEMDEDFDIEQKEYILNELVEYLVKKQCSNLKSDYIKKCRDHETNNSSEVKENSEKSHEVNKIVGKCPLCGNEISKETKNSVAIKCSQCGHTFWFD